MIEQIENIKKLTEAFEGVEFYNFHDAEIVSVKLDRNEPFTIEIVLQISHRIAEIEIAGKIYDRFRNFDATFKFFNIWLLSLQGFNHQNVINELRIIGDQGKFIVHFQKCFGCDLKFECERMKFIDVSIFETEKKRFIPDIEKIRADIEATRKRENIGN